MTEPRVCAVCYEDIGDSDIEMLRHYTQHHPDAQVFNDALTEIDVCVGCDWCGQEFTSAVMHDGTGLMVQNYCRECQNQNPVQGLSVEVLSPEEIVERCI